MATLSQGFLTVLVWVLQKCCKFRDTELGKGVTGRLPQHSPNNAGMHTFIQKGDSWCSGYEFRNRRLELFHKARFVWGKVAKLWSH